MMTKYVGIVAAPGAPDTLARKIKKDLPDVLSEQLAEEYEWEVEVFVDPLTGYAELTEELFQKTDEYHREKNWDYTLFITDLPIFQNDNIIAIDINNATDIGLISLPAFGWPPIKKSVFDTIVTLIKTVREDNDKKELVSVFTQYFKTKRLWYEENHFKATDSEHSSYKMKSKKGGYLRLISGMSWANNPFNMMRSLSAVVAIAFATGSFSMIFSTMWNLSSVFPTWRLLAISFLAIIGMLVWIIISHDLWETPKNERTSRILGLYNGATVLTLLISLLFYFAVLYLMFLTAGFALLPPDYIVQNIPAEQATLGFYFELAWFASSLSTVVAAIGAGSQDKNVIKESTYGYRQRFRSQSLEEE